MPNHFRPPYFPFYPADFSSDGKVESMTTAAVGAYILLLCKSWREDPPASIPNDDTILARWARMNSVEWAECKPMVLAAFTLGKDNRWHQKRLRLEYDKFCMYAEKKSMAGKIGAKQRWKGDVASDRNEKSCMATPLQSHCTPNTNALAKDSFSSSSSNIKENISTKKPERPRNPYWDSMVKVWGDPVTGPEKKRFGKNAEEFRKVGIDPNEIPIRHARAIQAWKTLPCSPETLLKRWTEFGPANGNGSVHTQQDEEEQRLRNELKRTRKLIADQERQRRQFEEEDSCLLTQ